MNTLELVETLRIIFKEHPNLTSVTRRELIAEAESKWAAYLADKYLPEAPPALISEVFEFAFEECHSSGYFAVETVYVRLARIVKLAIVSCSLKVEER